VALIKIENVSKSYDKKVNALTNLNLEVEEGKVFTFLGPNGSGKTTTIKLMNGLLQPDTGTIEILGFDPLLNPIEIRKVSGVVTEHGGMYDHMNGLDNLLFYGSMFNLTPAETKQRAWELLDRLNLLEASNRKLKTYSTGMRQRLGLARAMLHRPKLLCLDEPTAGLDPFNVAVVNEMIHEIAVENKTSIFLCTHQLRYAQEISNSYGLINKGHMLAQGSFEELSKLTEQQDKIIVEYRKKDSEQLTEETFVLNNFDETPTIVNKLVNDGASIYSVKKVVPLLEDIYFALLNTEKIVTE